jgi:hypothetical protein
MSGPSSHPAPESHLSADRGRPRKSPVAYDACASGSAIRRRRREVTVISPITAVLPPVLACPATVSLRAVGDFPMSSYFGPVTFRWSHASNR